MERKPPPPPPPPDGCGGGCPNGYVGYGWDGQRYPTTPSHDSRICVWPNECEELNSFLIQTPAMLASECPPPNTVCKHTSTTSFTIYPKGRPLVGDEWGAPVTWGRLRAQRKLQVWALSAAELEQTRSFIPGSARWGCKHQVRSPHTRRVKR